jgi:uncharacterized protein
MSDDQVTQGAEKPAGPRWRAVGAIDCRVLGVLAEKAKTTPDAYPLSLNALVAACNQKSNRDPVMQLEPDIVQDSLDRLREMGAVGLIESIGRVPKYRHYLYEWLGVEKVELSVMTELLLRGPQTEGELRGRVSRMDPVADLPVLRALLASLRAKNLVVALTPDGRGHTLTHNLYPPRELERLKARYQQSAPAPWTEDRSAAAAPPRLAATAAAPPPAELDAIRRELSELRAQLGELRTQFDGAAGEIDRMAGELRSLRDSLGG